MIPFEVTFATKVTLLPFEDEDDDEEEEEWWWWWWCEDLLLLWWSLWGDFGDLGDLDDLDEEEGDTRHTFKEGLGNSAEGVSLFFPFRAGNGSTFLVFVSTCKAVVVRCFFDPEEEEEVVLDVDFDNFVDIDLDDNEEAEDIKHLDAWWEVTASETFLETIASEAAGVVIKRHSLFLTFFAWTCDALGVDDAVVVAVFCFFEFGEEVPSEEEDDEEVEGEEDGEEEDKRAEDALLLTDGVWHSIRYENFIGSDAGQE